MIDALPPVVQRRYIKRPDLVTNVAHYKGGRIAITRVTPVRCSATGGGTMAAGGKRSARVGCYMRNLKLDDLAFALIVLSVLLLVFFGNGTV